MRLFGTAFFFLLGLVLGVWGVMLSFPLGALNGWVLFLMTLAASCFIGAGEYWDHMRDGTWR